LIPIGLSLVAVIALSVFASSVMQSSSLAVAEPASLSQLINYGGTSTYRDLTPPEIQTEIIQLSLTGHLMGIPLQGYKNMTDQLGAKGYTFTDSFFDVFMEDVQLTTPEGETFDGRTYRQWSEARVPDDGTKALLVGTVMKNRVTLETSSIVLATTGNVLPPEEVPGVDPYIIWNAEPFFYVDFWWWHPYPAYAPFWKIINWRYWWYDSHKAPNWFWGPYWWWRTYVRDYSFVYQPWYPWWWHWYYWRGWYWWSTYWPY
jgi:hypothetical protein